MASGIRLWQLAHLETPPQTIRAGFFYSIAFSSDGQYLVSGGHAGTYLRLWSLAPSSQPIELIGHQGPVLSLASSPDQTWLASGGGSSDPTIRIWQWRDLGAPPRVLPAAGAVSSLQFSADSRQLLSASYNGNSLRLWDLSAPEPTFEVLTVPDGFEPWQAHFGPAEETVFASVLPGIFQWDLTRPKKPATEIAKFGVLPSELVIRPDGNTFAAGSRGPAIYIGNVSGPLDLTELKGHSTKGAWSIDLSPDAKTLASGGYQDATVRLWDLDDLAKPSVLLGRHEAAIPRIRFRPDGKQIASASFDHSIRLWHSEKPDIPPIVLTGHDSHVWSVAYRADSTRLASGGQDNKILIWNLTHPLNNLDLHEIADQVCQKVWRNLSFDEWVEFVGEDIPYQRTCDNHTIHPSFFEAAVQRAEAGDTAGALSLLNQALEIDQSLSFDAQLELTRLRHTNMP